MDVLPLIAPNGRAWGVSGRSQRRRIGVQPNQWNPGPNASQQCKRDLDRYTVKGDEACWRVLCSNPHPYKDSLLGANGHLERMNAWTHIFAVVLFGSYTLVRPWVDVLDSHSLAGRASAYALGVLTLTFATSVNFHIFGAVPNLSATFRTFDHFAVVCGLAVANFADMALATGNFEGVPWQTMVDPLLAGVMIAAYFGVRRVLLTECETRIDWGDCTLGLWRFQHSDMAHSGVRTGTYVIMVTMYTMYLPSAVRILDPSALPGFLVATTLSLVLFIFGVLWDNLVVFPDQYYGTRFEVTCHSSEMGCVMTSHAWWHVLSVIASVCLVVGRELALSYQL